MMPSEEDLERVALAIGRVVTRGEVLPQKGWLEAARAAFNAIDSDDYQRART